MTEYRNTSGHSIMIALQPIEPGATFDDKGMDKESIKSHEEKGNIQKATKEGKSSESEESK